MPEIITKHPGVVKKVLQSARGVRCNSGNPKILKHCRPPLQFCSLPKGELCIYGHHQIDQMTQLNIDQLVKHSRKCSLCGSYGHIKSNRLYHPRRRVRPSIGGRRRTKKSKKSK